MGNVIEQLPPNDTEAESAVIGAILTDPEAVGRIIGAIEPSDFYRERNGMIYAAAVALAARHEPTDWNILSAELRSRGIYDDVGGLSYLSECVSIVATAAHVERYTHLVRSLAIRRRLISAAGRIAALGYDTETALEDALTKSAETLARVANEAETDDVIDPDTRALHTLQMIERLSQGEAPGISTGFYRLDRYTGGLRKGGLYVLGAPTGVGKTSWMSTVARELRKAGKRVFFASSEMTEEEMNKRDLAASVGRDYNELERELAPGEAYSAQTFTQVSLAVGELADYMAHVYPGGSMTTDKIRHRAARMKAGGGLDIVIVDYLQRLSDRDRMLNREQQVTQIARSLKTMAKELMVPVLVAAQFNRQCLYRTEDPEPRLSDFRESGGIEQEADVAMGLFREIKFRQFRVDEKGEPLMQGGEAVPVDPNEAYLFVLKNRHGREDFKVKMRWLPQTCTYANPADGEGRPEW